MLIIYENFNRFTKHVIEIQSGTETVSNITREPALVTYTYWLLPHDYEQIKILCALSGECIQDRVHCELERFQNILANIKTVLDKYLVVDEGDTFP